MPAQADFGVYTPIRSAPAPLTLLWGAMLGLLLIILLAVSGGDTPPPPASPGANTLAATAYSP